MDHIDISDYKCEANISKHLQKLSLGTCEKEYLSQKPASARGAHPIRAQGLILCVHLPLTTTEALSAACSLHQFTPTHTICWPKITHNHHPNNNPVSQTDFKNSYLAHNLRIKHTGCSSLPVSEKTSLGEPLFWEIPHFHKGGCVLTWTTTQKVSA